MARELKDALALHVLYGTLATVVLCIPVPISHGWRITALVLAYLVGVPSVAQLRGHREWLGLWAFLIPLSLFQVLPDAFLSDVLGVLVFPDDGSPRIGSVSAYMAGLWTIPFFLIVLSGRFATERWGPNAGLCFAGLISFIIFGVSEATSRTLLGSWYARDVQMVGDVALYVLLPELGLGLATFAAAQRYLNANLVVKVGTAFLISTFYTGALSLSYLWWET